jgi:DNA-binding transcriptional MerR regulator
LRFINRNRSVVGEVSVPVAERRKLELIRYTRHLGFDLHESLMLIRLGNADWSADRSCDDGKDADFMRQLAAVDERIVALMRLRGALLRLRENRSPLVGGIASLLAELNGSAHE